MGKFAVANTGYYSFLLVLETSVRFGKPLQNAENYRPVSLTQTWPETHTIVFFIWIVLVCLCVCVVVWLILHSMSLSIKYVCAVAYMCVYCLWWGEQLHVEERKKAARKKRSVLLSFKFADPINKVYLQPKSSNDTLLYTDRCWWDWDFQVSSVSAGL